MKRFPRRWHGWVVAFGAVLLGTAAWAESKPREVRRPAEPVTMRGRYLIELGRRLFHEPTLSNGGTRSCASCHDPEHGYSDPAVRSLDEAGRTPRHSQTLIDVDAHAPLHWDGEFGDMGTIVRRRMTGGRQYYGTPRVPVVTEPDRVIVEAAAVLGPRVMVRPPSPPKRASVAAAERLAGRYQRTFDSLRKERQSHEDLCVEAVSAFVASVRSGPSAYDRHEAGDPAALSASARRGLALFRGRARCVECHGPGADGRWPAFRDGDYHNTGVAWLGREGVPATTALLVPAAPGRPAATTMVAVEDLGRSAFDNKPQYQRAFKTPTLRDVARHPPYMHDGSLTTLEDVVRHYAAGCGDDQLRDPRLKGFEASDADVADLVAFLESLSSDERPGRARDKWSLRADRTRLEFVDALGEAVAGLEVVFTADGEPASGVATRSEPIVCTTDASGRLEFAPTSHTHVRMRLPGDIVPQDGPWVPDTCRNAEIILPVAGRARVALVAATDVELPETFRMWRWTGPAPDYAVSTPVSAAGAPTGQPLLGVVAPEGWAFVRRGAVTFGDRRATLYEGWSPPEGRQMIFRLPGQKEPQEVTLAPGTTVRVDVRR